MAAHAHLENEFTEDEKCHNLMSWLNSMCATGNLHGLNTVMDQNKSTFYSNFLVGFTLFHLFVCVGVLRPSQQQGHVEPVS